MIKTLWQLKMRNPGIGSESRGGPWVVVVLTDLGEDFIHSSLAGKLGKLTLQCGWSHTREGLLDTIPGPPGFSLGS